MRGAEFAGDRLHFRVLAAAAGISFELSGHVSAIKTRKSRCASAITHSIKPVARNAGIGGAGIPAAQRKHFARGGEAIRSAAFDLTACRERQSCCQN